jgi:hypothetical protein
VEALLCHYLTLKTDLLNDAPPEQKAEILHPALTSPLMAPPVCNKHGAVHPDKRAKGKAHGKYKNGGFTNESIEKRKEQLSDLRQIEDALFILGSLEGKQHTRGNSPAGYKKILTKQQAKDFITKLKTKDL